MVSGWWMRVQVFHCLQPAEQGGDTLLVDAFHAASLLRSLNKQAYDTLTRVSVEFEYRDGSHCYVTRHRVLEQDEVTRQLRAVRYNLYDRSPRVQFPALPRDVKLFYSSLQQFTRLLHSPDFNNLYIFWTANETEAANEIQEFLNRCVYPIRKGLSDMGRGGRKVQ
uniref:Gamma-butyrobetaine dioxygenase n=1 Tax=Cacopsylla melanoneura TaxID=428564 RepID=A0A8D8WMJ0_9HEMI